MIASATPEQVDPELRSALQKLGYATVEVAPSSIPHPLAPSARPNPMERTQENARVIQALESAQEDSSGDAAAVTGNNAACAWCHIRWASQLLVFGGDRVGSRLVDDQRIVERIGRGDRLRIPVAGVRQQAG